jgi:hypothetical protein
MMTMAITTAGARKVTWEQIIINIARQYGIGDDAIVECPWFGRWVERHGNHMRYSHLTFRWYWCDEERKG